MTLGYLVATGSMTSGEVNATHSLFNLFKEKKLINQWLGFILAILHHIWIHFPSSQGVRLDIRCDTGLLKRTHYWCIISNFSMLQSMVTLAFSEAVKNLAGDAPPDSRIYSFISPFEVFCWTRESFKITDIAASYSTLRSCPMHYVSPLFRSDSSLWKKSYTMHLGNVPQCYKLCPCSTLGSLGS